MAIRTEMIGAPNGLIGFGANFARSSAFPRFAVGARTNGSYGARSFYNETLHNEEEVSDGFNYIYLRATWENELNLNRPINNGYYGRMNPGKTLAIFNGTAPQDIGINSIQCMGRVVHGEYAWFALLNGDSVCQMNVNIPPEI
ncbi:hypothetical protein AGMMS49543_26620 [Betaproteobacteria bacterium]|nr:hypothetical protein AGMMS49543_26620 [Betaproteobacteria bacterium]